MLVQDEADSCRFFPFHRFAAGIFQASGSIARYTKERRARNSRVRKGARSKRLRAPPHRLDEPTGLSLRTVASPQSRRLFHPAAVVYNYARGFASVQAFSIASHQ